MATLAGRAGMSGEHKLFLGMAVAMTISVVAGFSLQIARGFSSFHAPLLVHVHGISFMGWTFFYLLQNVLATTGSAALHKRLGWFGLALGSWLMVIGTWMTVVSTQNMRAPFFFEPAFFLIMNPMSVLAFGVLLYAAVFLRRRSDWHRRLMLCGMAILTGPAWGRLLPMPLFIPYAAWAVFVPVMLYPIIAALIDRRMKGYVHPAWLVGMAAIVVMQCAIPLISYSPIGPAIYRAATAGTPAAALDPLAFPPSPFAPH